MALYDDASFIFLASGAAGVENKDFSKAPCVKPVEVLTSELNTPSDGDWTIQSEGGISISNGVVTFDGTQSGSTAAYHNGTGNLTGKTVKVRFTISDYEAGTCAVSFYGVTSGTSGTGNVQGNGSYSFTLTVGSTHNGNTAVGGGSTFKGVISNLSIKEATTANADFDISRDANLDATRVGPTGLIEKGRENKAHFSNNFSKASSGGGWGHAGINNLTTGQDGYDGTTNATAVFASTGGSVKHQLFLGNSNSAPTSVSITDVFTLSVHAKPNGYDHLVLRGDRAEAKASFNINTGVVGTRGSECIASSMTDVGNGFYRCQATFAPAGTISFINIGMMEADDTIEFVGNTSKGYILQDAQWELGLTATELIPSNGSAGTAGLKEDEPRFDYPVAGGPPSLLLEPERTNHVKHSEYGGGYEIVDSNVTVTDYAEVSPEGIKNAVEIEGISTSSATQAVKFGALESGSVVGRTFTGSLYIKPVNSGDVGGNVYLSIQRRNGDFEGSTETIQIDSADWKRYEITYTFTGALSGNQTGCDFKILKTGTPIDDIYVYGVQLEEGNSATSYIPCHGTAATRSTDNVAALDTSGFSFGTTCTIFFEGVINKPTASHVRPVTMFGSHGSPTTAERYLLFGGTFSGSTYTLTSKHNTTPSSSLVETSLTKAGLTIGAKVKCASVFSGTSFKFFVNGALADSGGTATVTAASIFNSLDLSQITGDQNHAVGSIVLWGSALTNQQCIDLTAL